MQRLPPLASQSTVWQLPLADPSAAALAEALIVGGNQSLPELTERLAEDAAVAVWTVVRAAQLHGAEPRTQAEAVGWLAANALEALRWPDDESAPPPPSTARHWSDLISRSVAAARGAEQLARSEPDVDPAEAYFLGLIHAAGEWLDHALQAESPAPPPLPEVLAARLQRLKSEVVDQVDDDPVLRAVAEAVLVLGDRRRRARSPDFDPDQLRSLGSRAARHWSTPVPGAGHCLPALVARLRQLDRLTHDFSRQLEQQKLAALKEFAYGAGHEINNPLANIATRAQTLLRGETDPERRRALATINSQVFRAHEMITDVMLFARPPEMARESVDLQRLFATVLEELRETAARQQTELESVLPDGPLTATGDREHLAAMLKALCVNALEALGHGGHVQVQGQRVGDDGGDQVQLIVRDDGPGIPAEIREHLFDPFFSGREAGRGLGFGLSKSWRIATQLGGRIDVENGLAGQGAVFTVTLPTS